MALQAVFKEAWRLERACARLLAKLPFLLPLICAAPWSQAEAQAPTVERVVFRGLADGDSTYYAGEVVRVRVAFDQHVEVDVSGGRPYIKLTVGAATRRAEFGTSKLNRLDFLYRVQADDFDDDGVSVRANALALNGAAVVARSDSSVAVDPAHDAVEGGMSRRVDGSRSRPTGPKLRASGTRVAEGDAGSTAKLEFAVRLSPAAAARVTVEWADAGSGSATSGTDYAQLAGGTLTFEPGDTLRTVSVAVHGDDEVEDDETVVLSLSGATNAELATPTATGTIVDDDEAGPQAPTVERVVFRGLAEGDSTYYAGDVVRVRVAFDQHVAVDVSGGAPYVELAVGAATRRAEFGTSKLNRLDFLYRVQADDFDDDGVSVPANALALNGAAVVARSDSSVAVDPAHDAVEGGMSRRVDGSRSRPAGPTLRASGARVAEGDAGSTAKLEFAVRLSPAAPARVTVDWADAGSGSATAGTDYAQLAGGTLTFEPGDTLRTVSVAVHGDDEVEGDETVALALSGATNAELATPTATGTIVDDDDAGPQAPTVERVVFRGLADGDSTYYAGEVVRVRVAFDQHVEVDVSGGRPYVELTVGAATRRAEFGTSKLNRLDFLYRVRADDFDDDGVSMQANALALNGAAVVARSDSSVAVDPAHDAVEGGMSRRVDGSRSRPARPTLRASGGSVAEGDAGSTAKLEFAVRLSPAAPARVTVDWADAGSGSATSGTDYAQLAGGTLTFEPGDTLRTVSVAVHGDDEVEDDETVALSLSGATNAELATPTATGTIVDDDDAGPQAPTVERVVFRGLAEGDSTYYAGEVVRVRVAFDQHVEVDVSGGAPYIELTVGAATRRAEFGTSKLNRLDFLYRVQADDFDDDGVSVQANALALNGAAVVARSDSSVAVDPAHDAVEGGMSRRVDGSRSRPARPTLRASGGSVAEGDAGSTAKLEFAVRLSPAAPARVTVDWADAGSGSATSGTDYAQPAGGTLTFEPGDTLRTVSVAVHGDDEVEDDETVALSLSGATNAELATPTATGTIVDDDDAGPQAPTVERVVFRGLADGDSTYYAGEMVRVRVAFDQHVEVDVSGGRPYVELTVGAATRRAEFGTSKLNRLDFLYRVRADDFDDDGVSVQANALALNGAAVVARSDSSVAVDPAHDAVEGGMSRRVDGSRSRPARPTLRASGTRVAEGDAGSTAKLEFAVRLSPAATARVTVEWADAGSGSATSGTDYARLAGGTLTFEPGDTLRTVSVAVHGDIVDEADETIVMVLANPVNADLPNGGATGVGTIEDDDDAPTLSVDSPAVAEGNSGGRRLTFSLALDRPSGRGIVLHYADAGTGTAVSGTDYETFPPDTLLFEPGETLKRIDVMVLGDTLQESSEDVTLRLSTPDTTAVVISKALITGRILDDDAEDLVPSFGNAAVLPPRWIMGCEIYPLELPQARGGDGPLTYGLAPAPPLGMTFNAELRTIAGAPKQEQPVTTYRYTATDQDGDSATLSFTAQVELLDCVLADDPVAKENRAPEVVPAIAPKTMEVASQPAVVDLSAHFRDPDGDELRYLAVSATPQSVRVDVAGSALTIHPLAVGQSLVTVQAADSEGAEAEQRFLVTVEASRSDRARNLKRSLAALGRTVGTETVEAVGGRLGAADDPGPMGESHLRVGGQVLACTAVAGCGVQELAGQAAGLLGVRFSHGAGDLAAAARAAAKGNHHSGAALGAPLADRHRDGPRWDRLVSVDPLSREELLTRSSFRFSPGAGDQATAGGWTFWGQANAGGFESRPEDDLALDGTVRSAYLGADYRFGQGPLVGLALSRTASSIGFESGINSTGTVDARLTSLYPYAQWSPRAGLSVWGLLGAGRGTADLSEDATRRQFETSIGMAMTAAGVRQRLTGVVAVKADAFAVRTEGDDVPELPGVAANVQRVRLASEVGGRWGLSGGSSITSRVEAGVRFDGGDAATGAGAEAGAAVGYVHEGIGLSVDARGRALVAHQATSFKDWGASVSVRLRPRREAGGLSFALEPTWGNVASGMAMLWHDGRAGGTLPSPDAGRLHMEMDYAIVLPDGGRVAPFGRWAVESGSGRRVNVGVRLSVLDAATVDLFGEQVSGGTEPADRRLALQGAVRFR